MSKPGRCPVCRYRLPPLKTCASETCDVQFYRGEDGRSDARYHSKRCARAQATRDYRKRKQGERTS